MRASLAQRVGTLEARRAAKAVNNRPFEHLSTDDLNEMLGWVLDGQPPEREVCERVLAALVKGGAMTQADADQAMEGLHAKNT